MSDSGRWSGLERWRSTAFLIGGLLLVADAAWLAGNIATGGEKYLMTGQFFVGTGWAAALLGLLGVYPSLADRSRWLSRAGAVCTAIGVVTFAVMAVIISAELLGILPFAYESVGSAFIPGVIIGSVLGFLLFSVAIFRTGEYSQSFGLLLLAPPVLVLGNIIRFILGNASEMVTLGVVIADALVILLIGYYLRRQSSTVSPYGTAERTV